MRALLTNQRRESQTYPTKENMANRTTGNKDVCAREQTDLLCVCTTLVILTSVLNALTHLITLLLYSGHQTHGLAVRATQCKVVLFVFELKRLM